MLTETYIFFGILEFHLALEFILAFKRKEVFKILLTPSAEKPL